MSNEPCEHINVQYYPALNDAGWRCLDCNTEFGFRPDLDKGQLDMKIFGLLHDLNEGHFVYVANGTTGAVIQENIRLECEKAQRYDQQFIIQQIMKEPNLNFEMDDDYYKKRWQIL